MNHWVKLLTVVMVGMFPFTQAEQEVDRPWPDRCIPAWEGKLGVCTILGKRQMLTKHDWLLEVLCLKIVVFMD